MQHPSALFFLFFLLKYMQIPITKSISSYLVKSALELCINYIETNCFISLPEAFLSINCSLDQKNRVPFCFLIHLLCSGICFPEALKEFDMVNNSCIIHSSICPYILGKQGLYMCVYMYLCMWLNYIPNNSIFVTNM